MNLKRLLLAPLKAIGGVIALAVAAWGWAKGEKEEGEG